MRIEQAQIISISVTVPTVERGFFDVVFDLLIGKQRKPLDVVHLRLLHLTEELSCV